MARDLLYHAADEVETARENMSDADTGNRLAMFADQLRSQADREATPALGALDRIHTKLRTIEAQAEKPTVSRALERARENILSFLETLDDRGMNQHGRPRNRETNGPS